MKDVYALEERTEILTGIIDPGILDVHLLIKLCDILKIPGSSQLTGFINSLIRETFGFNRYLRPEEKVRLEEMLRSRNDQVQRDFKLIKNPAAGET